MKGAKGLLRLFLVFALMIEKRVFGQYDILSSSSASFFMIDGELASDFTSVLLN